MNALFLDRALLPDGWATHVRLEIEDGFIRDVETNATPEGAQRLAGIALPGMPNLHCHAFQRAMAGLAEIRGPKDDSFWTWRQVMYRFLGALTPDDVEAIAAFAYAEMLEAGFTAVGEFHYLHHDGQGRPYDDLAEMSGRIAQAAHETGIGLTLLPSFYAFSTFGGEVPLEGQRRFINDPDSFLRLLEGARKAAAKVPDAVVGIAPHSLRAVTPETLARILAAVPSGPVHIHAAEQVKEVEDCLAWSGARPVQWLLDHAGLDERWCLIHATHMLPAEIEGVARAGAVVGLCPLTEASLGDGIFEGVAFMARNGRFGVGTDSNIEITAPGELKQLEYTQRLKHRGRNVLAQVEGESTGRRLYETALAGGAQAMGRAIGAIAPGKRADLIVLNADHPDLCAAAGDGLIDAIIFSAGKNAVSTVTVGGEIVVENGRHLRKAAITERYKKVVRRLVAA